MRCLGAGRYVELCGRSLEGGEAQESGLVQCRNGLDRRGTTGRELTGNRGVLPSQNDHAPAQDAEGRRPDKANDAGDWRQLGVM
jgi:hypothetical protein